MVTLETAFCTSEDTLDGFLKLKEEVIRDALCIEGKAQLLLEVDVRGKCQSIVSKNEISRAGISFGYGSNCSHTVLS